MLFVCAPLACVILFRPNTFSHQHASAMHWATWGGHTEIVKLLLEHKVRVPSKLRARLAIPCLVSVMGTLNCFSLSATHQNHATLLVTATRVFVTILLPCFCRCRWMRATSKTVPLCITQRKRASWVWLRCLRERELPSMSAMSRT